MLVGRVSKEALHGDLIKADVESESMEEDVYLKIHLTENTVTVKVSIVLVTDLFILRHQ